MEQEKGELKGEGILNCNKDGRPDTATDNSHTLDNDRNETESADQVRIEESILFLSSFSRVFRHLNM